MTDPRTAARRELAAELARDLEQRLRDLETFGGSCPCKHGEARAFLVNLKRLAGEQEPPIPPGRASYARR